MVFNKLMWIKVIAGDKVLYEDRVRTSIDSTLREMQVSKVDFDGINTTDACLLKSFEEEVGVRFEFYEIL